MKPVLLFALAFFSMKNLFAQPAMQVVSPNGKLVFQLELTPEAPTYRLFFKGQPVLSDSELRLDFNDRSFAKDLKIKGIDSRLFTQTYSLPVGKTSRVEQVCREAVFKFKSGQAGGFRVNLVVRVYDDGLAFRYEFPVQKKWKNYEMTDEHSVFHFAENPTVHALYRDNFTSSHEGLYEKTTLDAIPTGQMLDLPALFQLSDSLFVAITEAALRNYAGAYLKKNGNRSFVSQLSPLPGQTEVKVKASLPHVSPWRVVMVADRVGALIESNLLTNLNEPTQIKDLSWLKPGKTDWTWWHGDVIPNPDFEVGQNFETHRYYIDFCAANGIEYHAIIEHGNRSWYQTDGEGFDPPPPNADVTQPVATLDMERLAAYSKEKGVGLRLWVHWKPLSEKLEEAFALYEKWNVKGLMVDFMDRDDQEMVLWQEKVLQVAARHRLHVQFHGAYKPTGTHRTYPNEFTREGVLNLEALKWDDVCDPEHNLIIPFTRMLAGATDYHAGGFRAVPRDSFKVSFRAPVVLGTRCHHLAMAVVFENYLGMVADYPAAYENQAGFEFLRQVPTVWDETKVLNGQPGDFITVARRKGEDWFLGAMTDWTPRILEVPLDFLPEGEFAAEIFRDDTDAAKNPNNLLKLTGRFRKSDKRVLDLASGGGQVIFFRRL